MRYLIFGILFAVLLSFVAMGGNPIVSIVDGFVHDLDGNRVSGATVLANPIGCSVPACSVSYVSIANGYYAAVGVPVGSFADVEAFAVKGNARGHNTGQTDFSNVAHVNITICEPPSVPILQDVRDTHDFLIEFAWQPGVHDKPVTTTLRIDGQTVIASANAYNREYTSFAGHNWEVETCVSQASWCCSIARDTFNIGNLPPSPPTELAAQVDSGVGVLTWVSGIDPENDPTYDQFRLIGSDVIVGSNGDTAAIPQIVQVEVLLSWEVRTCDIFDACSIWVRLDTATCEEIAQECPDAEAVQAIIDGSGSTGPPGVDLICNGIDITNQKELIRKIEVTLGEEKPTVSLFGKNFVYSDLKYCTWCYDGIKNYDEKGVDCGGSCPACGTRDLSWWFLILVRAAILTLFTYLWYRRNHPAKHVVPVAAAKIYAPKYSGKSKISSALR